MSKNMCFYADNDLVSVQRGANNFHIFRGAQTPLAEREAKQPAILLAADRANSPLQLRKGTSDHNNAYSPYGHLLHVAAHNLLAYNGEYRDLHGCYFLGNGNRAYSPTLMRFISPDRTGIFRQGNHNAYGYCAGDPINRIDPSGNTWMWVKRMLRALGLMKTPSKQTQANTRPEQTPANMQIARPSDILPDIELIILESEVQIIEKDLANDLSEAEFIRNRAQIIYQGLDEISSRLRPYEKVVSQNIAKTIVDDARRRAAVINWRSYNRSKRLYELQATIRKKKEN